MAKTTGKQGAAPFDDNALDDMAPEEIAAYDDAQGLPSLAFAARYYAIEATDSLEIDAAIREMDPDWDGESPIPREDFEACAEDLADTYWERIEGEQPALVPEGALALESAREQFAEDFVAALARYASSMIDDDEDDEDDADDEVDERDRGDDDDDDDR